MVAQVVIAGYEERKRQAIADYATDSITYQDMASVFYESYGCKELPSAGTPAHMLESWAEARQNARSEAERMLVAYYDHKISRLNRVSEASYAIGFCAIAVLLALMLFALLA